MNQTPEEEGSRLSPVASTQGGLSLEVTPDMFLAMGYAERAALKETRPGVFAWLTQK